MPFLHTNSAWPSLCFLWHTLLKLGTFTTTVILSCLVSVSGKFLVTGRSSSCSHVQVLPHVLSCSQAWVQRAGRQAFSKCCDLCSNAAIWIYLRLSFFFKVISVGELVQQLRVIGIPLEDLSWILSACVHSSHLPPAPEDPIPSSGFQGHPHSHMPIKYTNTHTNK